MKKGGKLEKEVADFLVPFNEKLLCFQVKSRVDAKPYEEMTSVEFGRIRKTIDKGIMQLNEIKSAIDNNLIAQLRNRRGIMFAIDCNQFRSLIGIIVIDLIQREKSEDTRNLSITNGFTRVHGILVHVFSLDDYRSIASEIDTTPDFVAFLETRERFHTHHLISPSSDELGFLAFYKTDQPTVAKSLNGDISPFHFDREVWTAYQNCREQIDNRYFLNHPSYLIDDVIDEFSTSVGFTPNIQLQIDSPTYPLGSAENYFRTVLELSSLNRLMRREIGRRSLIKMKEADSKDYAYHYCSSRDKDFAILTLSTSKPREERAKLLLDLCRFYYCGMELENLIGVATENTSVSERSFDVLVHKNVKFENSVEFKALFQQRNPKMNRSLVKEYE